MIKFGIITPTFNRPELLKRCIQSVENQTYSNWIHVIVDDSTDRETEKLLLGSQKLHYLRNSINKGVCYSRNRAIDFLLENGVNYIVFLDDDDFFDQDTLGNAAKVINENSTHKWFVSRKIYNETKKSLTEFNKVKESYNYVDDYLIGKSIRRDTTHFIAANILKEKKIRFDEEIRGGGEWRFFAALSEQINFKFFEGGITFIEFQRDGLTLNNNKLFIATERAALVNYLHEKNKFKAKQIEYGASAVKHFIKLKQYDLLSKFYQDFINQKNPIIKMIFNLEIFILKRKYL